MPSIKGIAQASGYIAAYAAQEKDEDRFEHVICWTVIEFDNDDEPDEVVGQIFDGTCITEASSVGEDEGYGEFAGYFRDNEKGREEAAHACDLHRERLEQLDSDGDEEDEEESEEEAPKKKKKKKPVEEDEDGGDDGDEEEDDFSSWDDDE
jgi:hypothetical protein